jgi:hypothetical protein
MRAIKRPRPQAQGPQPHRDTGTQVTATPRCWVLTPTHSLSTVHPIFQTRKLRHGTSNSRAALRESPTR